MCTCVLAEWCWRLVEEGHRRPRNGFINYFFLCGCAKTWFLLNIGLKSIRIPVFRFIARKRVLPMVRWMVAKCMWWEIRFPVCRGGSRDAWRVATLQLTRSHRFSTFRCLHRIFSYISMTDFFYIHLICDFEEAEEGCHSTTTPRNWRASPTTCTSSSSSTCSRTSSRARSTKPETSTNFSGSVWPKLSRWVRPVVHEQKSQTTAGEWICLGSKTTGWGHPYAVKA